MYAHVKKHKTNVEFLAFLKYVRSLYPLDVLLYVILDNFSPHMVARVQEYVAANNIEFALTPTNASWLNPIESHVGPLVKFALSNFDPKAMQRSPRTYGGTSRGGTAIPRRPSGIGPRGSRQRVRGYAGNVGWRYWSGTGYTRMTTTTTKPRRWSGRVTRTSNALDLDKGVFSLDDPRSIAMSLKRSADKSQRRKSEPFQSAMSMLNFYINHAGKSLPKERRDRLEAAKEELRNLYQEGGARNKKS